MNILVRNLDRAVTKEQLEAHFRRFGTISSVTIVLDDQTGRSKGFGFVEMPNQKEAEAAIKGNNLTKLFKQTIRVKVAAPKPAGEKTDTMTDSKPIVNNTKH